MGEKEKLSKHLNLLREEYVKLQTKYNDVIQKYNLLCASKGDEQETTFVSRLLRTVANLFEQELYSDLKIILQNNVINAHKFILSSRSDEWGVLNLNEVKELDWRDVPHDIGYALLKWVYTDSISLVNKGDYFVLEIMKLSKRFKLESLTENCEKTLITSVKVNNCVKFYQTADEIGAINLRDHCSELISSYWNDFNSEDFAHMSAPLLFNMFKSKTKYPLHTAIKIKREDVAFLYFIEHNSTLIQKVNEYDDNNDLPLDLALKMNQESIAINLLKNQANINSFDNNGQTLLHRAVERHDKFSIEFLIKNGCSIDITSNSNKETPFHILCSQKSNYKINLEEIAEIFLENGADPNIQDLNGNTCLHRVIMAQNFDIAKKILNCDNIQLEIRNSNGYTPLSLSLKNFGSSNSNIFKNISNLLIEKGASVNTIDPSTRDTPLHMAAKDKNEDSAIYLINNKAKINIYNSMGLSPIHIAASNGLNRLVLHLLENGANCNLVTTQPNQYNNHDSKEIIFNQTPLHLAIEGNHEEVVKTLLNFKTSNKTDLAASMTLDLNVKNSKEQTPLAIALENELHSIAQVLIDKGPNVNVKNSEGYTLLHQALIKNDSRSAMFLLNYGAAIDIKTPKNETPLQIAVKNQIESVVVEICSVGADVDVLDENNNTPLWNALECGNEDIASFLVQFKCDTNCWSKGPGNFQQTYLHRALDENNEFIACFLIQSGCDVNSPRKPFENGEGDEEAFDGLTPLHLSCSWGLEKVVQVLLKYGANINAQDAEGKTPLHVSIINQHNSIINLLLAHPPIQLDLRDKYGQTPFATAMVIKNNKAAKAILDCDPSAAEKYDGKGRNFLHIAIQKGDIESVLFLLGINVNVHSRVKDNTQLTPLHLAVENGNEMILRNLILAGANINDLTVQKQTALHIGAENDRHELCSILIENRINFEALDINLNNALHIACQRCHYNTCKVLLTESSINAEALNLRGQNPLHLLCQYGKENAVTIFELFIDCMEKYPINKPDSEGNSPLLLAYVNGNVDLCKALVRSGACLGASNKQSINIFNCQVATKTLLFKLLDYLPQESVWSEGDICLECGMKFGLTNRKHHCRHCGRLLCNKCSSKELQITKFNLTRPVRVCMTCYDVLTLGFN